MRKENLRPGHKGRVGDETQEGTAYRTRKELQAGKLRERDHADRRILTAINGQISQLQQARALLTGNETAAVPSGKKRGRPKGSGAKKNAAASSSPRAGKRTMSAEGRAKIAAAQKARWAAQKKADQPAAKKAVPPAKKSAKKSTAKPQPAKKKAAPAKKAVEAAVESPAETTTAQE